MLHSQGSTSSEESLDPSLARGDDRDVYEELMILHPALCTDFSLVRPVAHGSQGSVFAVRCTLDNLPPNKLYALKVFYHDKPSAGECTPNSTSTQGESSSAEPVAASADACSSGGDGTNQCPDFEAFRLARQNEWRTLSSALRHQNIIRIWTCFEDNLTDELWAELPAQARAAIEGSASARGGRLAQFVVFDHHEQSVADYLKLRSTRAAPPPPLPYAQAKKWASQLLDVACFLKQKHVVHCDLKLEHLLLTSNHDLVVTGFSRAKHLRQHHYDPYLRGRLPYPQDNRQHIAPEVLGQVAKVRANEDGKQPPLIDYGGQTCWAVGVLIYECLMQAAHPLPGYPERYSDPVSRQVSYALDESSVRTLPGQYSPEFNALVMALLEADPLRRPDVADAKRRLNAVHDGSVHYRLSSTEAQLEAERRRSAELDELCATLTREKADLVQRRIDIVTERKQLRQRLQASERLAAELGERNTSLSATVDAYERSPLVARLEEAHEQQRELERRWTALNREKDDTVDAMDAAERAAAECRAERERLAEADGKLRAALRRSEARAAQLEEDVEKLSRDFGELYGRERKYSSESRRVKDGHLLTMKDLDTAQKCIADLEAQNDALRGQLQEREMEIIRRRPDMQQAVAQPISPYSTAPPSGYAGNMVFSGMSSGGGGGAGMPAVSTAYGHGPQTLSIASESSSTSAASLPGLPYQVSMESPTQVSPSRTDGTDAPPGENPTGFLGAVTPGAYHAQPSSSSITSCTSNASGSTGPGGSLGVSTPATPPVIGPKIDPLRSATTAAAAAAAAAAASSASAAPSVNSTPKKLVHTNSIPCLTPGCEFYGRKENEFFCSKCSRYRFSLSAPGARAATLPCRSKTEPLGRVREHMGACDVGVEAVRRRLDMERMSGGTGGDAGGDGEPLENNAAQPPPPVMSPQQHQQQAQQQPQQPPPQAPANDGPCREAGCQSYGSGEYGGRCYPCFLEMTKKSAHLEKQQREAYATMSGGYPPSPMHQQHQHQQQQHGGVMATAPGVGGGGHALPQRSHSMYQPVTSSGSPSVRHMGPGGGGGGGGRVCRSLGCMQPAFEQFEGFCLYCYQAKTTTPFYNEGAESCINPQCPRMGENLYGGFCRECYVRSSSEPSST